MNEELQSIAQQIQDAERRLLSKVSKVWGSGSDVDLELKDMSLAHDRLVTFLLKQPEPLPEKEKAQDHAS